MCVCVCCRVSILVFFFCCYCSIYQNWLHSWFSDCINSGNVQAARATIENFRFHYNNLVSWHINGAWVLLAEHRKMHAAATASATTTAIERKLVKSVFIYEVIIMIILIARKRRQSKSNDEIHNLQCRLDRCLFRFHVVVCLCCFGCSISMQIACAMAAVAAVSVLRFLDGVWRLANVWIIYESLLQGSTGRTWTDENYQQHNGDDDDDNGDNDDDSDEIYGLIFAIFYLSFRFLVVKN